MERVVCFKGWEKVNSDNIILNQIEYSMHLPLVSCSKTIIPKRLVFWGIFFLINDTITSVLTRIMYTMTLAMSLISPDWALLAKTV